MQWLILFCLAVAFVYWLWRRFQPPSGITQFSGKVVLVTGASSGIGSAVVKTFANLNAQVIMVARRGDVLEALKASLPEGRALALPADITRPEESQRVIEAVKQQYGRLDILINCAGIVDTVPLEQIDEARIQQIVTLNLIAPINLIRLALPLLRGHGQAHIVNVSSTVGLTLVPRQATYGASKAGLNGFTDALRRELHGTDIGVSMVMPGLVNTPMLGDFKNRDEALEMLKKTGMSIPGVYLNEADEVAESILDAIRYKRRAVVLGGWLFVLLAWMGQHTPLWLDGIYTQMFKTEALQESVVGKS